MIHRRPAARPVNRLRGSSARLHQLDVQLRSSTVKRRRREWLGRVTFQVLLLAVIGAASFFGIHAALGKFFFHNAEYTLRRITLDLDNVFTRDEALAAAGLREGVNIFSVDLAKVEASLKADPQVESVRIERELPDHLAVTLVSRDPVAWLAPEGETGDPTASERSLLVDAKGFLMRPRHMQPEFFALPVVFGLKSDNIRAGDALENEDLRLALHLIETVSANPHSLLRIRTVDVSKGYCLQVVDHHNARITFATADFEGQLQRLQQLLAHCEETGRSLDSVNLMVKRNTPVTFVAAAPAPPERPTSTKTRRN